MAKVLGIGGIFFRSRDYKSLVQWYQRHFGLKPHPKYESFRLQWADGPARVPYGFSVLAAFEEETEYFRSRDAQFMVNLAVDDLDAIVKRLRAAGVEVEDKVEEYEYGKFAWVKDPEGRTIELWEPRGPTKPKGNRARKPAAIKKRKRPTSTRSHSTARRPEKRSR